MSTNKTDEIIDGVYELAGLHTNPEITIDTINIISEMESYRGKISSDIDNIIDWQLKRNLSSILERLRLKQSKKKITKQF